MTDTTTTVPPPPPPRPYRRRGMFWPLVLIGVGLVALLANYGLIQSLSIVSILALWPVLLILLGVDIAFARRWPVPTLAAEVVIIAASLYLAATQPAALALTSFTFNTPDCSNPAASVTVPRGAMQSMTLRINGGAARYHLTGGASAAVEATSDQAELCLRDRSSRSGSGDVILTQSGARFGNGPTIEVRVASDMPLSLQVNAGAGEFTMDLRDVKTSDARLAVGASNTTIVLPRPSSGDIPIRVDGGASNIIVEIPSDVEARVTVSGGLVSSDTTNPRTTKSGNTIQTAGYAAAKDRVTVTVNGGATSVAVR
jgi:hypothetical protein